MTHDRKDAILQPRGTMARVLILCGGRSAEHEISLLSAAFITETLAQRHTCHVVYIRRDGLWHYVPPPYPAEAFPTFPERVGEWPAVFLGRRGDGVWVCDATSGQPYAAVDVVFPALHGPYGEDGTVQGLLDLLDVPYVGAGVLGSALGMDKLSTKRILQAVGLPVVRFVAVDRRDWSHRPEAIQQDIRERLPLPVFVKPSNLGSSIGITRVDDWSCLTTAVETAFQYDDTVLVEEGLVPVRELECSVLDGDPPVSSVVGEITYRRPFYDYVAKYHDEEGTQLHIPADLPPEVAERVRRMAVEAFLALRCQGMARVDFFLHPTRGLFIDEINTIPGFTRYSMYHRLWAATGLPADELLERLLALAVERSRRRRVLKLTP